jgi:hypothetical protein
LYINYLFGYRDEEFGFDHIAQCHCFNDGCPLPGNMSEKRRLYHMIYDDVSVDELMPVNVVRPGRRASPWTGPSRCPAR